MRTVAVPSAILQTEAVRPSPPETGAGRLSAGRLSAGRLSAGRLSAGRLSAESPTRERLQPSAAGGVLLLAQVWAALGGSQRLGAGLRWQGAGRGVLLFAAVVLPLLSARSVRAVAQACAQTTDPLWAAWGWGPVVTQRRLARFLRSPRHDWRRVQEEMVRVLARHPATAVGAEGLLVVDSTTVEKRYGPHLPDRRPVYDVLQEGLVDGYEVVSACVVGRGRRAPTAPMSTAPMSTAPTPSPTAPPSGEPPPWPLQTQMVWPLGLEPHRKAPPAVQRAQLKRRRRKAAPGEWPSKLDLALEWVRRAVQAGVTASTVVGDSSFAVMWWLREIAALDRHWLVAARSDRRLRIGAEIRSAREWASHVPLTLITAETGGRKTTVWGGQLTGVTLLERHCQRKGLPCQFAYFERRNRRGQVVHRWYLVTSQTEWDLLSLWHAWQARWAIEGLHRDGKQHLRLSDFHARTWEGIVAWLACTTLRLSLLCFLRAVAPAYRALSLQAVVTTLRQAACLIEHVPASAPAGEPGQDAIWVHRPPTLPASSLWSAEPLPLLPPEVLLDRRVA